jgi:hypothetical protein
MRTGSIAGVVSCLSEVPSRNTRTSSHSGRNRDTGSLSSNRPSSHSCIAATDVTGLVIE